MRSLLAPAGVAFHLLFFVGYLKSCESLKEPNTGAETDSCIQHQGFQTKPKYAEACFRKCAHFLGLCLILTFCVLLHCVSSNVPKNDSNTDYKFV